jgi:hypothetical protein
MRERTEESPKVVTILLSIVITSQLYKTKRSHALPIYKTECIMKSKKSSRLSKISFLVDILNTEEAQILFIHYSSHEIAIR